MFIKTDFLMKKTNLLVPLMFSAVAALSTPANANSVNVTVDGIQYVVTNISGTYNDVSSRLTQSIF